MGDGVSGLAVAIWVTFIARPHKTLDRALREP
jgi:hypothetical protein